METKVQALRKLTPGCLLDLSAERDNPHDAFAVEIRFGSIKLGYVPRSDNRHISRLLAQGATLKCTAIEINPDAEVWNCVRVEIGMLVDGYECTN
ncbi:MAG: HIRAN domain-containing protein [Syntrophobacteraceae bacterium]